MKLSQLLTDLQTWQARKPTLDPDVEIWLPGSRIYLTCVMPVTSPDGVILIEGNLRPGSALDFSESTLDRLDRIKREGKL